MSNEQSEEQHDVSDETEEERNERLAQQAKERGAEARQKQEARSDGEFARVTAVAKKFVYVDIDGEEHEYMLSPLTALDTKKFAEKHGAGAMRRLDQQADDLNKLSDDEWENRQAYMWTLMHLIFQKRHPELERDDLMEMFPLSELAPGGVVDAIVREMMPNREGDASGGDTDAGAAT